MYSLKKRFILITETQNKKVTVGIVHLLKFKAVVRFLSVTICQGLKQCSVTDPYKNHILHIKLLIYADSEDP